MADAVEGQAEGRAENAGGAFVHRPGYRRGSASNRFASNAWSYPDVAGGLGRGRSQLAIGSSASSSIPGACPAAIANSSGLCARASPVVRSIDQNRSGGVSSWYE